ncbi:unnamed protein product (macronuclear) [Paramecium tetraurelia]|uniref:Transmembrane protein n=1 Tax=Paramecium tetraurelia TaxID=5888 RepID=A0D0V6_PARTE|nr:uncharacterized protein GSPATT00012225001 [Paramecium tetraurelia]CAK76673.1 unnamed protein product [Paramecium tetraurelia]|eukprot:XP_001444070.1 hypothetical protein (macronuclear) [Paramecium tetraurelia strain d4-2]
MSFNNQNYMYEEFKVEEIQFIPQIRQAKSIVANPNKINKKFLYQFNQDIRFVHFAQPIKKTKIIPPINARISLVVNLLKCLSNMKCFNVPLVMQIFCINLKAQQFVHSARKQQSGPINYQIRLPNYLKAQKNKIEGYCILQFLLIIQTQNSNFWNF